MNSSVIVYLVGGVILRAGGIVLLPIVTRNLDPSEYGTLELLNRATDILLICLFLNGICLAAVSFYNQARSDEARRRVVGSVLVLGCALIGMIGSVLLIFIQPIGVLIGVDNPGLVRLAFLAALGDGVVTICLSLIQARTEAVRHIAFSLACLLIRVGLIVNFVCLFGWGVRGILLASLITSATMALTLVALEVNRSGIHLDLETISGLTWFAVPFLPGGLCGFLLGTGDQFILAQYATTAEIGLYALGYKLVGMVGIFSRDPLMKVWGAKMHQVATEPEAPRIFGRVFTGFAGSYLLAGLGLALFGQEVISVLCQSRYLMAATYIPPVLLAYFFMGGSDFMDAAFYIQRRSHLKLWITLASTAATLALYLLLIPRYHALGAAYATLGGFACRVALTYVVSQRLFRVTYEWDRVSSMLIVAVCCWWLGQFAVGPAWVTIPVKVMILFLFPAVLWLRGQVAPQEMQVLLNFLNLPRRVLGKHWIWISPATRET